MKLSSSIILNLVKRSKANNKLISKPSSHSFFWIFKKKTPTQKEEELVKNQEKNQKNQEPEIENTKEEFKTLLKFFLQRKCFTWDDMFELNLSEYKSNSTLNRIRNKPDLKESVDTVNKFKSALYLHEKEKFIFSDDEKNELTQVTGISISSLNSIINSFQNLKLLHELIIHRQSTGQRLPKSFNEAKSMMSGFNNKNTRLLSEQTSEEVWKKYGMSREEYSERRQKAISYNIQRMKRTYSF
jgi:hypothetical protein